MQNPISPLGRLAALPLVSAALCAPFVAEAAPASAAGVEQTAGPIPGPNSCMWRGPFSADPYMNVAYPDANVFYWSAFFNTPAGAKLAFEGEFAHARYQSFISYDNGGKPVEALADYLIEPAAGSVNPYRDGADRTAKQRHYRVNILDSGDSLDRMEGYQRPGKIRSTLRAPTKGAAQTVLYRIYLPDAQTGPTGGVGLPRPVLTLADGRVLRGEEACNELNSSQELNLDPGALGISVAQYRELTSQPGKPDTWPAKVKPEWHIQLDRPSLIGIYTGEINNDTRRSEGGFYPNPDNNYIRTVINLRHGPILLLRGKMPRTPRTVQGEARMTEGDIRYWSICSNQSFANTRVNDCLFDEEVPTDKDGRYTIVISKEKDRPRNAVPECGIAWLPVAEDGDGVADPDVAIVQIRNLLARDGFAEAIQAVDRDGRIDEVMGAYKPEATYTMPNVVESLFMCPRG